GNGADALINDCLRAFCEPGTSVLLTRPTYSLLAVAARIHGLGTHVVAMGADGSLAHAFTTTPAPLRVLVNPNTPTGTWIEPEHLATALDGAAGVVVIDEAYCDFAPRSCIPLLADLLQVLLSGRPARRLRGRLAGPCRRPARRGRVLPGRPLRHRRRPRRPR